MTTDEAFDTLVRCWMMEDAIKHLRKVAYEVLKWERDKIACEAAKWERDKEKPKLSLVGE